MRIILLVEHIHLEHFLVECIKTKAKLITTTNQRRGKNRQEPKRSQCKTNQTTRKTRATTSWLFKFYF